MLLRGTGVWMQQVALPWYAVELGAGPAELGVIAALLFLPTFVFAPIGGLLADRVDRARMLIGTQLAGTVQAGALFLVVVTDGGSLPLAAVFALIIGVLSALELPIRQSYLTELVPPEDLTSAVSLHATAWNTSRFIGPAVAGGLIATTGVAATFAISAVIAVLVAGSILLMEQYRLPRPRSQTVPVGVREGFLEGARFAVNHRRIRWCLTFVAAGGIFGIQSFQTLAPLYVADVLGLGGGAYGAFMAVWGAGAVVAAYIVTIYAEGDRSRWLVGGAAGLATVLGLLAAANSILLAFVLAAMLGFAQIALVQNSLITVQFSAPDQLRGRIMGFYVTVFQGTSPIGALFAGVVAELAGVRGAMLAGGLALGVLVLAGARGLRSALRT